MSPGVAWLRMWLGESEGGQVWCRGAKAEMAISRILGRGLPTKGPVSTAGWCLICQLLVLLAIPAFFNNPFSALLPVQVWIWASRVSSAQAC